MAVQVTDEIVVSRQGIVGKATINDILIKKKSFNTVSKNLDSYDATTTYNANGDIDTVVYDLGNGQSITKTINYLPNGDIDTKVLSGDTPTGIDLTKTIVYNVDGDIVNRNYS